MHSKKIHVIPLNRTEGDLEIHFQLDDGMVSKVRSAGTMYRGFENLLKREITPGRPGHHPQDMRNLQHGPIESRRQSPGYDFRGPYPG